MEWHISEEMCHSVLVWCASKSFFESADPNAAFLACRWHELFDQYTPDTFHPRLYGLSDLVDEAVEIGSLHQDHDAWAKHLIHVRAEIRDRLVRGFDRSFCSPRHGSMIQNIEGSESPTQVARIGRVLQLEKFADSVKKAAASRLETFDRKAIATEKSNVDDILETFATIALRSGYSPEDFGNISTQIQGGTDQVITRILEGIPTTDEEFDCVIAVHLPDPGAESAIRAVCRHAKIERTTPRLPGLPKNDSQTTTLFLRRKIRSIRAFDAIDILKREVRDSLSILALYQQSIAPAIDSRGWIVTVNGAEEVPDRMAPLHNLHPRRDATKLADNSAEAIFGRSEPSIRAALELHDVALASADHKLRLVNLWSAMECLASILEEDKIITRVQRLVVPILTWRKVDKIVRYLAISIHFWLQENPKIDLSQSPIRFGHNKSVPPEQLITLLAEPENSAKTRALLNLVSGHPLLGYRIHQAWKIFHTPSQLVAELERTSKRLEWHLWRIYRARNLLVHQGVDSPCIPQLANHLQQYFSWTLSRVLHGLTFGPAWKAVDSWSYWKSKSDHVLNSLHSQPDTLTVGDMFPENMPAATFPIWNRG